MWVVDNNTPFAVERGFLRDRQGGEVWIVAIKARSMFDWTEAFASQTTNLLRRA
jgi:hypothetical protein